MSQQPSGIDLARAALAAARADAKTGPVQPDRKKRRTGTTSSRRRLIDPLGVGGAIAQMMSDRGWEPPEPGGSILDQWPTIAPELVGKADAVRFEHDAGVLHLQPVSPAYATQLRLHQQQVLQRIREKTGNDRVRELRILAPGGRVTAQETAGPTTPEATATEAPVKTRDVAHPGYRETLALALENRRPAVTGDPYVVEAMRRQEAALRANRQPEPVARVTDRARPSRGSMAASEAAARAYARRQAAAGEPRRAFDVA